MKTADEVFAVALVDMAKKPVIDEPKKRKAKKLPLTVPAKENRVGVTCTK